MKKKFGFTLAEVLITMSIIGIVAAMTTPSLVSNAQKAKIGPAMRKFMNTLENANEALLAEKEANKISDAVASDAEYLSELTKYIEGTVNTETASPTPKFYNGNSAGDFSSLSVFNMKSGEAFWVGATSGTGKGSYKGIRALVLFDLNGFKTKPNKLGKDMFYFWLDESGSLVPYGGKGANLAYGKTIEWTSTGDAACNITSVGAGTSCAGSVADNDWKVVYK